ncbi:MAG: AAA family ATPase [Magnetococcales bacterium]|nr:AAA family ATPase [Magnetococcales bacterium]
MRIDRLIVKNFKCFEEREFTFHPEFNLIVGMNGTGKTAILDALSVAVGSWLIGFHHGEDARPVRPADVLLKPFVRKEIDDEGQQYSRVEWISVYPCKFDMYGSVLDRDISWSRSFDSPTLGANLSPKNILVLASGADLSIQQGKEIILPMVAYYGTGRLCENSRESYAVSDPVKVANKEESSRLAGYRGSVDPRLSVSQLIHWIAQQSWITAFMRSHGNSPIFTAVKNALISCVEDATDLYFDPSLGEVVVELSRGKLPLSYLSDGQRSMLAMVGDIAHRAAKLNPHLGGRVLLETPGVVLIDELDLHLHPRWQRRVIEDLRKVFPRIQFICTTHSPFLIQSLRSGEELILLDGQSSAELGNVSIEEIARGIQQVENPQFSRRYAEMRDAATDYLHTLDEASRSPREALEHYKARLATTIAPFAANPAFQAFLEMKRVATLGE